MNIHTLRFLKSPKFVPFEVEAVCNFSKGKGADLLEIKIHLLATNRSIIRLLNSNKSNNTAVAIFYNLQQLYNSIKTSPTLSIV